MHAIKKRAIEKIASLDAKVGVIGLGAAGLPLAWAFATAGMHTIGFDVDELKVDKLKKGEDPLAADGYRVQPLLCAGALEATAIDDVDKLRQCDVVCICVPTPVTAAGDPDMRHVVAATETVTRCLRQGVCVILQSTVYPGATREVVAKRVRDRGFCVGVDVFVAHSPERLDLGNRDYSISDTPRVVGGITFDCCDVAMEALSVAIDQVAPLSSAEAAEMTKLYENGFRAVAIGYANETVKACHALGIDPWEIVSAAATKPFGFMRFDPGPGVGGDCIPTDPLYLMWRLRASGGDMPVLRAACDLNDHMPAYWADIICQKLLDEGVPLEKAKVMMFGMTYKRDVADVRRSPAIEIAKILASRGVNIAYYDPYVPTLSLPNNDTPVTCSSRPIEDVKNSHCAVITTDHSVFESPENPFRWEDVTANAGLMVDTRGVYTWGTMHGAKKHQSKGDEICQKNYAETQKMTANGYNQP